MSYRKIAEMAADVDLNNREAACAATLGITDPASWVAQRTWQFAASDGWAEAYAASQSERPGLDEDAVTDVMILAAVGPLIDPAE